jgi:ribosomal protein L7/L12
MDALAYLFLSLTALIIILSINSTVKRLDRKLKRIDMSLSLILNRMEIEFPSRLSERVKQMALDPDRKIEAIKLYREETNLSLKEAKEAVEDFLKNTDKF